ncbi:hypothetical protein ABZX88_21460 [Kitasatospora aureofaciens]|uniref:hypothetical protein n=1 Tax=Kitasatospora aureofaciens TaxID=1894 RepID=UPI0033BAB3BE
MPPPHLPTTQSAVLAIEAVAARHGRAVRAQHDIGSDRTFAGLVGHDEVTVTVEGIPFDVPRDSVPAFLNSVWSGLVHVRARTFPPSTTLIVTVPGEAGYRESLGLHDLTPWLSGRIR